MASFTMIPNRIAISSTSLGRHVSHRLEEKITLAAQHSFAGIEIVYAELEVFADRYNKSMVQAAQVVKELCEKHKIEVLSLAPFENFEGGTSPLSERLCTAQHWIDVSRALGATYLQVPAQYDRTGTGIRDIIVKDLQQLADLAGSIEPIIKIAYEPMSWSVHVATWEAALDIINRVHRSNFGLCLDSFHIMTKLWGNSWDSCGRYPDADLALERSLAHFREHFPIDKLFFVQLSDAEHLDQPFSEEHPWYVSGEAPEFTWSKYARPFPGEIDLGGYTPVAQFLKVCVMDTGFGGWISLEVFDRRMQEKTFMPADAARRAEKSWLITMKQASALESKV